jgi:hypothetical protein
MGEGSWAVCGDELRVMNLRKDRHDGFGNGVHSG